VRTVVDASAVAAALVDDGETGDWALSTLSLGELLAPHAMPAQVTDVLRRAVRSGQLSDEVARLALGDLVDLKVTLLPYGPFAERIWELRDDVDAYQAWCIAAAESMDARLVTLDPKVAKLDGLRCRVLGGPQGRS
jgi:predicted nucleic acid-binding protein